MKRACFVAVLVLVFACTKTETTTDSAAADSAANTTTVANDVNATIDFSGLVTHVLGPYQRAVVVYSTTHPHKVTVRDTSLKTEAKTIMSAFPGGSCIDNKCSFLLQYMSLQLLNAKKEPLSGDLKYTDGTFERRVTDLDAIDPVAFTAENLAPEVTGDVKEGSTISWGYVDLRGGEATTTALPCQGRLAVQGTTGFSEFSGGTTVNYPPLAGGGFLRVIATSGGKPMTYDIPFTGPDVLIEVDNNLNSNAPHFHEYDKLTTAAGHTLPNVVLDQQSQACRDAIGGSGGVPGCTDTRTKAPSSGTK